MIKKFLDPKNDIVFKRIFGIEANKDILIDFINSVFYSISNAIVESIEFLPTIDIPTIASDRVSIVDVLCIDNHGKTFIIEMQVVSTKEYLKRAQYYAAKAYINQKAQKDSKYKDLKEVIFLAICAGTILPLSEVTLASTSETIPKVTPETSSETLQAIAEVTSDATSEVTSNSSYISHHQILDIATHERHLKEFSFTFIELGKFNKTVDQLDTTLDKWVYFFKHANYIDTPPNTIMQEPYIQKALHEICSFNWTQDELWAYDHLMAEKEAYINSIEEKVEQGVQRGMKRGIEIGIGQGIKLGMQKGLEQGENTKALSIAKEMLKKNIDRELIKELTGLSDKQLEKDCDNK